MGKSDRMNTDSEKFKWQVFQLMNGELKSEDNPIPESSVVKNEFEDGILRKYYQEAVDAGARICKRLNVEEDKDVELIIANLMRLGEHQAMKMYDYGRYYAKHDVKKL